MQSPTHASTRADVSDGASDLVAIVIRNHLRALEADGYGQLEITRRANRVTLKFGAVTATGEDCDIALVRLGSALLDDEKLKPAFLARMSSSQLRDKAPSLWHGAFL